MSLYRPSKEEALTKIIIYESRKRVAVLYSDDYPTRNDRKKRTRKNKQLGIKRLEKALAKGMKPGQEALLYENNGAKDDKPLAKYINGVQVWPDYDVNLKIEK